MPSTLRVSVLVGLLMLAMARPTGATSQPLRLAGRYGGATEAVALRSPLAFTGVGAGLEVIDLGDPAHPRRISAISLGQRPRDIALAGDYAYVLGWSKTASGEQSLFVVDIHNPAAPALTTTLARPAELTAGRLAIAGKYLFAASDRIQAYDISSPTNPVAAGMFASVAPDLIYGLATAGRYVYVGTGNGLHVFDAADPASATQIASFLPSTAAWMNDLIISGQTLAALSSSEDGSFNFVRIFDLRNPRAPVIRATVNVATCQGGGGHLATDGRRVYLLSFHPDLLAQSSLLTPIDVTNPRAPKTLPATLLPSRFGSFDIDQNLAGAATSSGLQALVGDQSGTFSPKGAYEVQPYAKMVEVEPGTGRLLSLGPYDTALLSLGEVATGRAAGVFRDLRPVRARLSGQRIYAAEGDAGLGVYKLSASGSLSEAARLATAGYLSDVRLAGSRAYALDSVEGLLALDLSSPDMPRRLSATPVGETLGGMAELVVAGERAFVNSLCDPSNIPNSTAHVEIFSLSGATPERMGAIATSCLPRSSIAAWGNLLFLAEPESCFMSGCDMWLRVMDVSDPAAPEQRALLKLGSGGFEQAVAVTEGYVAVAWGYSSRYNDEPGGAVRLFAFSPDGGTLSLVEEATLPGQLASVAISGANILIGGGQAGLLVLRSRALFQPTAFIHLPLVAR